MRNCVRKAREARAEGSAPVGNPRGGLKAEIKEDGLRGSVRGGLKAVNKGDSLRDSVLDGLISAGRDPSARVPAGKPVMLVVAARRLRMAEGNDRLRGREKIPSAAAVRSLRKNNHPPIYQFSTPRQPVAGMLAQDRRYRLAVGGQDMHLMG